MSGVSTTDGGHEDASSCAQSQKSLKRLQSKSRRRHSSCSDDGGTKKRRVIGAARFVHVLVVRAARYQMCDGVNVNTRRVHRRRRSSMIVDVESDGLLRRRF